MAEPKARCPECGAEFLQATATITGGLCMKCKRTAELKEEFANYREPEPVPPVSRRQLDLLLATASPRDLIDALFEPAADKVNFRPFEMTEGDIIIYTIWTFLGETLNGGFIQYLTNQSGQWAHYCGKALRCIGAEAYALPMERCIAAFTTEETAFDWESDLEAYCDEHDDRFEEMEEEFWTLFRRDQDELPRILAGYIKDHPDLFAPC
jgi:DNA-directed RNA polymerase subunit RPC12/RpoP